MKCLFAVRSGTSAGGEEEEGEEEEEGWGLTWHQPPYLALYTSLGTFHQHGPDEMADYDFWRGSDNWGVKLFEEMWVLLHGEKDVRVALR